MTGSQAPSASSFFLSSDGLSHVAFSSCAAIVARTLAHPLDTLKTRIQFAASPSPALQQPHSSPATATSLDPTAGQIRSTIRGILATESPTALYRGLPVALLFSVPALSVYLGAYDQSKAALAAWGGIGTEDSMGVHAAASCTAEILSGALWTPMEVLKNKLQVQTKATHPTIGKMHTWNLCKSIYAEHGLRGFFKGYFIALGVFIPYTMVYFMSYEQLKLAAAKVLLPPAQPPSSSTVHQANSPQQQQLPFAAYVACSGLSGALAGGVSNGLDIVKTRKQAGGGSQTAMQIAQQMWRHEGGWRAFGRGLGARILWITPTVTISMSVYEELKNWRARQMSLAL
ncbi:hypothetical protein HDU87_004421 [Geranomyces variabilis]|uniref:Mitochondrial carrier n=1 Tax=Geranomyces variabilis TaxID=109894 RepID=A0AAD5XMG0_9FUNG|nr:hypothetical protein HDU87_004421 [Geranomyces variabilis]